MRSLPGIVAAVVVAALWAWPPAAADAGQQGHAPKKETPAAKTATAAAKTATPATKPETPAAKADAHAPKAPDAKPDTHAARTGAHAAQAEAARPPAAKQDDAKGTPSVDEVLKRINAILAEGPGPDASRKAGAGPPASTTAPKPRSAAPPRAARTPTGPPSAPVAPAARAARTGVVLKWDPALTKRGVALVWDAELTGTPEPSRPGVRLLWPER